MTHATHTNDPGAIWIPVEICMTGPNCQTFFFLSPSSIIRTEQATCVTSLDAGWKSIAYMTVQKYQTLFLCFSKWQNERRGGEALIHVWITTYVKSFFLYKITELNGLHVPLAPLRGGEP